MRYLSSAVKDAGLIKELEGNIRAKTQYYISENISSSETDVNGRKVFCPIRVNSCTRPCTF